MIKAEWTNADALDLQPTCNKLATDCVSRQAAIDAFMTATSDGDKFDWCKWVLKQVPSAQPEQRWIPVTERLPKKCGDYLVTTHNGQIARYIFIGKSSEEYWRRCTTAWMPLPEPYAERRTDDC